MPANVLENMRPTLIASSRPAVAIDSENRCAPWCVEMFTAASENMPLAATAPSTQPPAWAGM